MSAPTNAPAQFPLEPIKPADLTERELAAYIRMHLPRDEKHSSAAKRGAA